jgi:hypothetical protein
MEVVGEIMNNNVAAFAFYMLVIAWYFRMSIRLKNGTYQIVKRSIRRKDSSVVKPFDVFKNEDR